jgi:hypothetical protein
MRKIAIMKIAIVPAAYPKIGAQRAQSGAGRLRQNHPGIIKETGFGAESQPPGGGREMRGQMP